MSKKGTRESILENNINLKNTWRNHEEKLKRKRRIRDKNKISRYDRH